MSLPLTRLPDLWKTRNKEIRWLNLFDCIAVECGTITDGNLHFLYWYPTVQTSFPPPAAPGHSSSPSKCSCMCVCGVCAGASITEKLGTHRPPAAVRMWSGSIIFRYRTANVSVTSCFHELLHTTILTSAKKLIKHTTHTHTDIHTNTHTQLNYTGKI